MLLIDKYESIFAFIFSDKDIRHSDSLTLTLMLCKTSLMPSFKVTLASVPATTNAYGTLKLISPLIPFNALWMMPAVRVKFTPTINFMQS